MTKINKTNNSNNNHNKTINRVGILRILALGGLAACCGLLFTEIALAKFDINAGVKAATDPLIKAIEDHWGKGVLLSGGASALVGEGDARQRAIRAGIGCSAAGAVVLGLVAMLK